MHHVRFLRDWRPPKLPDVELDSIAEHAADRDEAVFGTRDGIVELNRALRALVHEVAALHASSQRSSRVMVVLTLALVVLTIAVVALTVVLVVQG